MGVHAGKSRIGKPPTTIPEMGVHPSGWKKEAPTCNGEVEDIVYSLRKRKDVLYRTANV
jgi:hypothetical protein